MVLSVVEQLILVLNYIILVSGFIGNTLNVITFTRIRIFRGHQCIFYLIIKSIIDNFHLFLILISRLSIDIFQYNLSKSSQIWCKLKFSFYQTFIIISLTTICFAAINQCLLINHIRRLRLLKFLYRFFFILSSIWILYGILFFIFFQIQSPLNCSILNIDFLRYYAFFNLLILICFFPLFISLIFSWSAYRNVRHLIRPQLCIIQRKLNRQLTAMIFGRVIFLIIATIPFVLYSIYSLNNQIDEENQSLIEVSPLVPTIFITLFNTNFSCDFYVYLLSSSRYRRQVKYICTKKWFQWIRIRYIPRRNQVTTVSYISKIGL